MSSLPEELSLFRPTFAEVNLDAFRRNLRAIKGILPAGSRLIAVLKANAYGHGAVPLARICEDEDAEMIAVALFEEARELQDAGIDLPILILGPLHNAQIDEAVKRHFIIGVVGPEELALVCEYAEEHESDVRIHLKLDSGMGRMGLRDGDLDHCAELLRAQPRVKVDAIYTHFANASDPRDPFTDTQQQKFEAMLARLRARGVTAPLIHRTNSPATMRKLVAPGEYARVGLSLYGAEPLDVGVSRSEPLLSWRARIVRLKTLSAGESVGYGTTWTASRESIIATLPVGYADGYSRSISNKGAVLIRGKRAPVIGRVSMDLVTVDVTAIANPTIGDVVTLLGRDGEDEISVEEMAGWCGTINYEVLCAISARVPRVYRDGEKLSVSSRFAE
jgi:alanine racemase